METIGNQQLWSWLDGSEKAEVTSNTRVRAGKGCLVHNYLDLAKKIAELQYRNRDYVLLFRGQSNDYKNRKSNSSLRPSMFRARNHSSNSLEIRNRYDRLRDAEHLLLERYNHLGAERIKRYQLIRWAILQHYEVCDTPLLDVTTSIRIAASFASLGDTTEAFIYALGVPNLSGAVTASAEASVTTIRLASVCPPEAVRPHIQEGYLLGEYPEIGTWDQKRQYENYETDFGLRLVAKFRFNPHNFWNADMNFPQVTRAALYPSDQDDPLARMMHGIRLEIG
jgi:hypothetical protein